MRPRLGGRSLEAMQTTAAIDNPTNTSAAGVLLQRFE